MKAVGPNGRHARFPAIQVHFSLPFFGDLPEFAQNGCSLKLAEIVISNPEMQIALNFYQKDNRLHSIMIEVNRRLYLDDEYRVIQSKFVALHQCINELFALITQH
jgi:hypothetical protein